MTTEFDCSTCYDTKTIDRNGREVTCPERACLPWSPTFRKPQRRWTESQRPVIRYQVHFGQFGEMHLGHVERRGGIWVTTHADGTKGPQHVTRIAAAWALVNA